jgi:hypothetical protein
MIEYFDRQIDIGSSIEFMIDRLSGTIDLLWENRAREIVADRQYRYN